jgi:hypothetical protein
MFQGILQFAFLSFFQSGRNEMADFHASTNGLKLLGLFTFFPFMSFLDNYPIQRCIIYVGQISFRSQSYDFGQRCSKLDRFYGREK